MLFVSSLAKSPMTSKAFFWTYLTSDLEMCPFPHCCYPPLITNTSLSHFLHSVGTREREKHYDTDVTTCWSFFRSLIFHNFISVLFNRYIIFSLVYNSHLLLVCSHKSKLYHISKISQMTGDFSGLNRWYLSW